MTDRFELKDEHKKTLDAYLNNIGFREGVASKVDFEGFNHAYQLPDQFGNFIMSAEEDRLNQVLNDEDNFKGSTRFGEANTKEVYEAVTASTSDLDDLGNALLQGPIYDALLDFTEYKTVNDQNGVPEAVKKVKPIAEALQSDKSKEAVKVRKVVEDLKNAIQSRNIAELANVVEGNFGSGFAYVARKNAMARAGESGYISLAEDVLEAQSAKLNSLYSDAEVQEDFKQAIYGSESFAAAAGMYQRMIPVVKQRAEHIKQAQAAAQAQNN